MVYSRYESMIAASPRHEMEIRVKMGLSKEGMVRAVDVYTLSNTALTENTAYNCGIVRT